MSELAVHRPSLIMSPCCLMQASDAYANQQVGTAMHGQIPENLEVIALIARPIGRWASPSSSRAPTCICY